MTEYDLGDFFWHKKCQMTGARAVEMRLGQAHLAVVCHLFWLVVLARGNLACHLKMKFLDDSSR